MPITVGCENPPRPLEHAHLRTGPRSMDTDASTHGPAPAAGGDSVRVDRWFALPHFSERAKSAAQAGGVLALLGGAFAAGHYDQAIARAIQPRPKGTVAPANAPAAALAPSAPPPYVFQTNEQLFAETNDVHGKMYVDKALREPYDDFLTYIQNVPGAQKTLARLESAKPYSSDSLLRVGSYIDSFFEPRTNFIHWNSTLQYFFQGRNGIGTNSAAAVLLGLMKQAEDASRNYGAYIARSAMGHPDHDTLEDLFASDALNADLAALPNEDARVRNVGIVEKTAANVTDTSPKEFSAAELQQLAQAPIYWNDTSVQDFAINHAAFARRRDNFFGNAQMNAPTFGLPVLQAVEPLLARGEAVTAQMADARLYGTVSPALQQELEHYTRAGLATAAQIHYIKRSWTVIPDPADAAPAAAPSAASGPAEAPAPAPQSDFRAYQPLEIGPGQAP